MPLGVDSGCEIRVKQAAASSEVARTTSDGALLSSKSTSAGLVRPSEPLRRRFGAVLAAARGAEARAGAGAQGAVRADPFGGAEGALAELLRAVRCAAGALAAPGAAAERELLATGGRGGPCARAGRLEPSGL